MDILCLGVRIIGVELATELVASFLNLCFSGEERRHRRLEKVLAIERQAPQTNRERSNEEPQ